MWYAFLKSLALMRRMSNLCFSTQTPSMPSSPYKNCTTCVHSFVVLIVHTPVYRVYSSIETNMIDTRPERRTVLQWHVRFTESRKRGVKKLFPRDRGIARLLILSPKRATHESTNGGKGVRRVAACHTNTVPTRMYRARTIAHERACLQLQQINRCVSPHVEQRLVFHPTKADSSCCSRTRPPRKITATRVDYNCVTVSSKGMILQKHILNSI